MEIRRKTGHQNDERRRKTDNRQKQQELDRKEQFSWLVSGSRIARSTKGMGKAWASPSPWPAPPGVSASCAWSWTGSKAVMRIKHRQSDSTGSLHHRSFKPFTLGPDKKRKDPSLRFHQHRYFHQFPDRSEPDRPPNRSRNILAKLVPAGCGAREGRKSDIVQRFIIINFRKPDSRNCCCCPPETPGCRLPPDGEPNPLSTDASRED